MTQHRMTAVAAVALTALLTHAPAYAQDSLQTAKDLYASAAYEDALSVIGRLRTADPRPEVDQFRVFCLIALGRTAEAEKAIQAVVAADPHFVPDAADVSPRIVEVFTRTRRQLVPDIAREMYATAKAALERKDREASIKGFDGLVQLIDSTDPATRGASLSELRLLAAGFLDLSRALRSSEGEAPKSTAKAAVLAAETQDLTPAVAIKQSMPAWVPTDGLSRQVTFVGEVRIKISATGRVDSAEIVRSIHPGYDRQLLAAARSWEYQPARRNGVPAPSEQVVQVQLKPRQ